jgi:hypothetical protein
MTQWGLDTLFNPSKRHMDEEKQRLQSTREEVGDNSGGRRIDFDSGRVTIRKGEGDAESAAEDGEAADGSAPEASAKPQREQRSQRPQSDAQRRAAERRAAKRRAAPPEA